MVILTDTEKAFDKTQHPFRTKIPSKTRTRNEPFNLIKGISMENPQLPSYLMVKD